MERVRFASAWKIATKFRLGRLPGGEVDASDFQQKCRHVDALVGLVSAPGLAEVELAIAGAPVVHLTDEAISVDRNQEDGRAASMAVQFRVDQGRRLQLRLNIPRPSMKTTSETT